MAKGGNSQRNNCSRFTKPHNTSNSFVTKVASRVSDYLGGWFGTPLKSSSNAEETNDISINASGDTVNNRIFDDIEINRSSALAHRRFDDVEPMSSSAKRFKISETEKVNIDFPVSPIPSTSGLFQSAVNHTFDIPKSEDFASSVPGPSNLQTQRYSESHNRPPSTSTATAADVKTNGANDNHSDSSESTSGCSSLVPQSDRLSQSVYVCSSRKRNLEEKLNYARQLQQSRASMYLNRSIPVNDTPGGRKKPSFDVTAYGTPPLDKSLLKEKLMNSPFYTGQTSYGGASAYRLSRNTFYSQRNPKNFTDRREGMHVQVKPSHHGSTEDLSNMSHTAKKILEALEQFSTPVSDAKRIPTNRLNVPLGSKRRRFDDLTESRIKLSTPISPLNPNPGPVITGLNVPTVPDLLKLKRLEKIQNSTAAARQVAVQKQEYSLPSDVPPTKRTGKIMTKLKDKDKVAPLEKLEEVNLPKIPLPITTLPKFDFQFPSAPQTTKTEETKKPNRQFTFSNPIPVAVTTMSERFIQKNNFTFSDPLKAEEKKSEAIKSTSSPFTNFMSSDAVAKLKRKSINDKTTKSISAVIPSVPAELKTGSVMDYLSKSASENKVEKESSVKATSESWECGNCLIRNLSDNKICRGCKKNRISEEKIRTSPNSTKVEVPEKKPLPVTGFGDKFKPPSGSWSCKECFVNNKESADKCIACETPKVPATNSKKDPPPTEPTKPTQNSNGFGDLFKKQANQWECSVCMVRNKETDAKCVACETPKPGTQPAKTEPKFNFGIPPATGGFKFGIDKADAEGTGVKSAADSSTFKVQSNGPKAESTTTSPSQFSAISTSVGVFTFGIPPTSTQDKKQEPAKTENIKTSSETSSSGFMVTSTSGSNIRKDAPLWEQPSQAPLTDSNKGKAEMFVSDSTKSDKETPKPFFFGVQKKISENQFGGLSSTPQEKKEKHAEPETKTPKFFFGSSSNSLETVSSSTTDIAFGQTKPATSIMTETKLNEQNSTASVPAPSPAPAPPAPAPAPTPTPALSFAPTSGFQIPNFGTFGSAEANLTKPSSNPGEINKTELQPSVVSTSATTSAPMFASGSVFNSSSPKMTFGTSTSSTNIGFGSLGSTSSSPFTSSTPSFGTPSFNSQAAAVSSANSFGIVAQPTEKPPQSTGNFFSGAGPFSNVGNPFGSSITPSPNPLAPKSFGGFGTSVSSFGNTATVAPTASASSPAPTFGSGFMQTSNAPEKPFVFGASSSVPSTSFSTPSSSVGTAPGLFQFGAAKPDPKPVQFTFGQSSNPNFNFGANQPIPNLFGGINQSKPESAIGVTTSPFGTSASPIFGQATAPAALESTVPKFEFGVPVAQPQEATPSVFQFGATPTQPQSSTAPPGTGFSLSVPQKFNFTGGQAPVFSAESPSIIKRPERKTIRAVRRTNRDATRRPN